MNLRRFLLPLAVAAVAGVGLTAGPSDAAPVPDPSIKIAKKPDGPYTHNPSTVNLSSGDKKTFYLKVKNGTDEKVLLYLQGSGPDEGFIPKWFYKGTNITEDVNFGFYSFNVKPDRVRRFTMTVKRTLLSGPTACIYTNIEITGSFHDGVAVEFNSDTVCLG